MPEAKPFSISKHLVAKAFRLVKANRGAAGVDGESVRAFEKDLKDKPLQGLELDVIRELLPTSGSSGGDFQG